jgi:hypothetical protein
LLHLSVRLWLWADTPARQICPQLSRNCECSASYRNYWLTRFLDTSILHLIAPRQRSRRNDGTFHFIARLVTLVRKQQANLIRFCKVFVPKRTFRVISCKESLNVCLAGIRKYS